MNKRRIAEHGHPTAPGTYWIILEAGAQQEKDVAAWDGEIWRYTDRAADYLWGEPYGMPVIAWIDDQERDGEEKLAPKLLIQSHPDPRLGYASEPDEKRFREIGKAFDGYGDSRAAGEVTPMKTCSACRHWCPETGRCVTLEQHILQLLSGGGRIETPPDFSCSHFAEAGVRLYKPFFNPDTDELHLSPPNAEP